MNELREILLPVLAKIRTGVKAVEIAELWGGARALCVLELFQESGRHLLVVTANEEEAETLADDLRFFAAAAGGGRAPGAEVLLFPPWGVLPFEADSPDSGTVGERMHVLYRLMTGGPCIVVAPRCFWCAPTVLSVGAVAPSTPCGGAPLPLGTAMLPWQNVHWVCHVYPVPT